MKKLADYSFEKIIHSGSRTVVSLYKKGDKSCAVKHCVKSYQYANKGMITHEYEVLKNIHEPGIIRAYELIYEDDEPYLVLEYFTGESLRSIIETKEFEQTGFSQELQSFFDFSLKIADALKDIHAHNIIHKDINPQNILYDQNRKEFKIIDFGLSSSLKNYMAESEIIQSAAGTLAYMSPEQTGRTNHAIDFQSDLYSFGVLLYQLMTGQLPFIKTDWVDYIYAHIAEEATSPSLLRDNVPNTLSNIILKLLNKSPDDRYKSIQGVINDLKECEKQWLDTKNIKPFALGKNDPPIHLKIPEKMYGREAIVKEASDFESKAVTGSRMLVVKGMPGIGKSTLIAALKYEWVKQNRRAFEGQYEQFKRNISYSAFIQSLRLVVKDILKNEKNEIERFKSILLDNGTENLKVLCDLLPELEIITGLLPPGEKLDPQATQRRLESALLKFISSCAIYKQKLILILDDLQWADLQSSQLIEKIMKLDINAEILLCATTRVGGEYDVTSFMSVCKDLIIKKNHHVLTIELPEIDQNAVTELLSDTLNISKTELTPFAQLLHNKTGGNPLFIKKMLDHFYDNGILKYDFNTQAWNYDISAIERADVFNDLSEFLLQKFKQMQSDELNILSFCACLGKYFVYKDVISFSRQDPKLISKALKNGIQNNILIQESGNIDWLIPETGVHKYSSEELSFRFSHDKLQQACIDILDPKRLKEYHQRIARRIIELADGIENVIDMINLCTHLNHSPTQVAWEEYCFANLQAGATARNAGAFQDYVYYMRQAFSRMPENAWTDNNGLASKIYIAQAEVYIFQNDLENAGKVINDIQKKSLSRIAKITAAEFHLNILFVQDLNKEGMEQGIIYLNEFYPKKYPVHPSNFRIGAMMIGLLWRMRNVDINDLPHSNSEEAIALSRLCANILFCGFAISRYYPIYFFYAGMIYLIVVLDIGVNEFSYLSFIIYALLIYSLGFRKKGFVLAEQILNLMLKEGAIRQYGYGFNAYSWAMTWRFRSFKEMSTLARDVFNKTMEVGDYRNASYTLLIHVAYSELSGAPREEVLNILEKSKYVIKDISTTNYFTYHQACVEAMVECDDPEVTEQGKTVPLGLIPPDDYLAQLSFYTFNALLQTILSNYKMGFQYALGYHKTKDPVVGSTYTFFFIYPFCLLASHDQIRKIPWRYMPKLMYMIRLLKSHSKMMPDNFEYQYYLILGEVYRLRRKEFLALEYYKKAITSASKYKNLLILGIAYERAALLLEKSGFVDLSREYLYKCAQSYSKYGSNTKLNALDRKYNIRPESAKNATDLEYLASKVSLDMDLFTKAANVITSELDYTRLLTQLLDFAKTASGAQKIALLMKEKTWEIVALLDKNKQIQFDFLPHEIERSIDMTIISYVIKTREMSLIDDAEHSELFAETDYVKKFHPKSILVFPLIKKSDLIGILYLENNLSAYSFSNKFIGSFNVLSSQIAIAIEKSTLFTRLQKTKNKLAEYSKNLEIKVADRTKDLLTKNTELNKTLKEVEQLQGQLIQKERIVAMNDLTKGLSHELKNPLNFISNFSDINVEELDTLTASDQTIPPSILETINIVKSNAQLISKNCSRIQQIVVLMEEHGQIEADICNEFSFSDTFNDVMEAMEHKYKESLKSIQFNRHFKHQPDRIVAFQASLALALECILNNAIYTIFQKQTQIKNYHGRIDIKTATVDHKLKIEITDNGEGIEDAILDKIWLPFFTTKTTAGVGLGLSLAYGIINTQHRGEIHVTTELGKGSTFTVQLPTVQPGMEIR